MKLKLCYLLGALAIITSGCKNSKDDNQVISQRYIHKYGYAVSSDEWQMNNYPGQVITHLRNGVTITASYENGTLHGPYTRTFPNSQTAERFCIYNQGNLVKEQFFDSKGMPVRERIQLSPTRQALTTWYANGTPLSVEEYASEELLEGQYFTIHNEIEARVEKGHGKRIKRDQDGLLLAKEDLKQGYVIKREAFYPSGSPESIVHFTNSKIHGEKRTFLETGEPLAVEEWINGKLHGKSTYYKNGTRTSEATYLNGQKNGLETLFEDGEKISQKIYWSNGIKHGPVTYYLGNSTETEYYYSGERVSKKQYDENARLDEMISQISPELRAR